MAEKTKIVVLWFKRDLRVQDHQPLWAAARCGLPVLPLYVVEPDYWQQPFASRRHWQLVHEALSDLNADLATLGQPLVVRVGTVVDVLQQIAEIYDIHSIHAHEETGNGWTYARDKAVLAWCRENAVSLKEYPCNGVVRRLKHRDGWAAERNQRMAQPLVPVPERLQGVGPEIGLELPAKDDPLFGTVMPAYGLQGGRRAGEQILQSFLYERGERYVRHLSEPGASAHSCSRLSTYLALGVVSAREVVKAVQDRRAQLDGRQGGVWRKGLSGFRARLSWRCHFIQKLEDQPELETTCMHRGFEGMRDSVPDAALYEAWRTGQTGFPFVDACMRSLNATGWLNFRMRAMLVSFASYQLWLDWRATGHHLAQVFADYEPGIHYSQLQMQSGVTGINTLRIYNPIKQSHDQDAQGAFIRRWVPELRQVSDAWVHEPWKMDMAHQKNSGCVLERDYPLPVVEHFAAVKQARARIVEVRRSDGFRQVAQEVYEKLGSRKRPAKRKGTAKRPKENGGQLSLDL